MAERAGPVIVASAVDAGFLPFVEVVAASIAAHANPDRPVEYHVLYDGSVIDEQGYAVLGGEAEAITERLKTAYDATKDLAGALQSCIDALSGPDRTLTADELEVAVLDRVVERRAFRRIIGAELEGLVPSAP